MSWPGWPAPPGPSRRSAGSPAPHASIEGNALAACCRLALAADPRVRCLAEALISWQWPDGGWNCAPGAARRSSFHESLAPAWGLHEYWQATGDTAAKDAASQAAELFLAHRLFRTLATGQVIHRAWLAPHYPPYWHYDILQALLILSRMDKAGDPRTSDALDELERRRLPASGVQVGVAVDDQQAQPAHIGQDRAQRRELAQVELARPVGRYPGQDRGAFGQHAGEGGIGG
jgi:hypothetical protein